MGAHCRLCRRVGWRRRRGRPGGSTPSCGTKRTGVLAAAEKGGTFSPTAAPTYAPTALPLRPHVSAGGSYHCGPRVVRLRQYPGEGRMGRCARMRGGCTPKGYSPCSHLGTSVRRYPTELCTGTARARWGRPARRRPARSARRGTPPPRLPGALPNRDSLSRLAAPVALRRRDSVGSLGSLP